MTLFLIYMRREAVEREIEIGPSNYHVSALNNLTLKDGSLKKKI
jgi:hypothetical protein